MPRAGWMSRALVAISLLGATAARAQTAPASASPDCRAHPDDPRCHEAVPAHEAPASGSGIGNVDVGSCGGGGGGSGDGVAILFVAVVGAALLPVMVYAFDDDASPESRARWSSLSGRVLIFGGGTTQLHAPGAGFAGGRITGGTGLVGVDASLESALQPDRYAEADGTLVLRLPPKQHVELGLALGGKMLQVKDAAMTGFEVAVPHRYLFGSLFSQRMAIDVRPSVATNGDDLALTLEAGIQIPLPGPVSARLSGRVWSLNHDIEAGGLGGFEVAL